MDNLTHSLVGLVAGEAMARCTAPDPRGLPAPARRNTLIAISIIGSNLPDIDLAWSMQFVTGDRMGYLLQRSGDEYVVRRAQLSVLPHVSVDACSMLSRGGSDSLFTHRVEAVRSEAVRWHGEYVMSRAVLAQLAGSSCTVRELLQFARVPFAVRKGQGWVLGDLRFDNGRGGGMTEVTVTPGAPEPCRHDVPWVPPRAELIVAK